MTVIAVFGGMATATLLGVFVIPVLYVVIQRFAERRTIAHEAQAAAVPSTAIEVLR